MAGVPSPRALYPSGASVAEVTKFTDTLAERLWSLVESKKLLEEAKQSNFIRGIAENKLDARQFGTYMLQDCTYLAKARDNFILLQHNIHNTDAMRKFFEGNVTKYTEYASDLHRDWYINEQTHEPIRLSPAARDYIGFEAAISANYWEKPWYSALGTYPCYRLWPQMAEYLKEHNTANSAYREWIENNSDSDAAKNLAALLEEHAADFDYKQAKRVFLTAFKYEVAFFNSISVSF